jgi:hypothetical protein
LILGLRAAHGTSGGAAAVLRVAVGIVCLTDHARRLVVALVDDHAETAFLIISISARGEATTSSTSTGA